MRNVDAWLYFGPVPMVTDATTSEIGLGVSENSVLLVAHPAHELLIHHWMEQAKPSVLILTDGAGSAGTARIASSRVNVLGTGAQPGPLFGAHSDAEIYRKILHRDLAFFRGVLDSVTQTLVDENADVFVSDPVEHYSPAHDLCATIAAIAHTRASRILGHHIRYLQFPIEYRDQAQGIPLVLHLPETAIARKLAAAGRVPGVAAEKARLLAMDPLLLASEILWEMAPGREPLPAPETEPFYEHYGRLRITQGLFSELITYRHHLRPLVAALAAPESRSDTRFAQISL